MNLKCLIQGHEWFHQSEHEWSHGWDLSAERHKVWNIFRLFVCVRCGKVKGQMRGDNDDGEFYYTTSYFDEQRAQRSLYAADTGPFLHHRLR